MKHVGKLDFWSKIKKISKSLFLVKNVEKMDFWTEISKKFIFGQESQKVAQVFSILVGNAGGAIP